MSYFERKINLLNAVVQYVQGEGEVEGRGKGGRSEEGKGSKN